MHRLLARASVPLLLAVVSASPACKKGDDGQSTDPLELIPADIQGIYGRGVSDEPGMVVSATGLELGQMKLTIHAGKMEGSTVRVERATLQWKKLDPKTCSGTISRQGDRLLMTLYDDGHPDAKCESILDAEWFNWSALDELPATVQGRYGPLLVEPKQLKLDLEWVHEELVVETIRELPGTNDERAELLIADAKVVRHDEGGATTEFACSGKLSLDNNRLSADFWVPARLVPEVGSEDAEDPEKQEALAVNERACDDWDGHANKWIVRLDNLPKQPIASGDVKLEVSETRVVLDSPDLRCEHELWGTESVDSQRGWSGAVIGGERMTLGKAAPARVSDGCKRKLRTWCELDQGTAAADIDHAAPASEAVQYCLDNIEGRLCPDTITVREISNTLYKIVQVEPQRFYEIACVDVTGDFKTGG